MTQIKKRAFGFGALVQTIRDKYNPIKECLLMERWLIHEYSKSYGNNLYRGFYALLKQRLHTALIHKPTMLYLRIRNYTRFHKFDNQNLSIMWELQKPLTLTYAFRSTNNFCPSCAKLEEDEDIECEDLNHAEFIKFYERPIWSFKFKYYYTACTCEDLLFEPLDRWYGTGGEEGSPLFSRVDAQWDINEKLGWDLDPMKRHKKRLLPWNWKSKKEQQ